MSPSYTKEAIATRIATEQKRLGNNGVVAPLSRAPFVGDGPVRAGERRTRSGRVVKNSRSHYKNNTSVKPVVSAPPLVSMTVPVTQVPASVQPLVGAPPLSQVVMLVQVTEVPATDFLMTDFLAPQSCISVQCVAESCAVRYWESGHDCFHSPLF